MNGEHIRSQEGGLVLVAVVEVIWSLLRLDCLKPIHFPVSNTFIHCHQFEVKWKKQIVQLICVIQMEIVMGCPDSVKGGRVVANKTEP